MDPDSQNPTHKTLLTADSQTLTPGSLLIDPYKTRPMEPYSLTLTHGSRFTDPDLLNLTHSTLLMEPYSLTLTHGT